MSIQRKGALHSPVGRPIVMPPIRRKPSSILPRMAKHRKPVRDHPALQAASGAALMFAFILAAGCLS